MPSAEEVLGRPEHVRLRRRVAQRCYIGYWGGPEIDERGEARGLIATLEKSSPGNRHVIADCNVHSGPELGPGGWQWRIAVCMLSAEIPGEGRPIRVPPGTSVFDYRVYDGDDTSTWMY